MDFWYTYIVLAEIYVLLGLSTNLLVGIVGIFSVSQAAVSKTRYDPRSLVALLAAGSAPGGRAIQVRYSRL